MAEKTKIQWCDHTFNPWIGCAKVAAGCANCYAEADFDKRRHVAQWGPSGTRIVTSDANWKKPLKWNSAAERGICVECRTPMRNTGVAIDCDCGSLGAMGPSRRPSVFCASLADVFEDWPGQVADHKGVPISHLEGACEVVLTLDDCRCRLFALIDETPNLDWLLLTKRPEHVRRMWSPFIADCGLCEGTGSTDDGLCPQCGGRPLYRENVWLGTSIATQADADRNIPELLKCRDLAAKLFVSAEPLIEAVDLSRWTECRCKPSGEHCDACILGSPDWVIVGGESGPHARPCNVGWIRSLVEQCRNAGVPCFVKQLGARPAGLRDWCDRCNEQTPTSVAHGLDCDRSPILRDPKGGDPSEWPADLRVREFPST